MSHTRTCIRETADWMYEGMQFGSLSTQLPTNEQPFKYTVHVSGPVLRLELLID